MNPLLRSHCRWSIPPPTLLHREFISPKALYQPLRTYATPQVKRYEPSTHSSKSPSAPALPLRPVFPTQSPSSIINPPSSTHPPPLDLPQKEPNLPVYKYYFRLGKAYANFYKTGLKAIWTNYKAIRSLPKNDLFTSVRSDSLTRANFQLIRRARDDINKLPPFMLLWLICGEFTPLVVPFVTGVVPRTIWIPKQVESARKAAEARRRLAKETHHIQASGPALLGMLVGVAPEYQVQLYKYIGQIYGLYPGWWDRYMPPPILYWLVRRRVGRRVEELEVDDYAIERDGGVKMMEGREVVRACEVRGMDVLGKGEDELRRELGEWLARSKGGSLGHEKHAGT